MPCDVNISLKFAVGAGVHVNIQEVRDGPFHIQGGGLGFFLVMSYFFSFFVQQIIFSKLNLKQVFLQSNTLLRKCEKQQIE